MGGTLTGVNAPAHLQSRMDLALAAALEAGALTLRYFRTSLGVERKSDNSPVTVADREAELLLRRKITESFPGDAIVGEEFPRTEGTSGYRWILDPIDGTKSFICGVPLYGTLVGVEYDGRSVIGVIVIPALNECVFAAEGSGAWYQCNERDRVPAHVSDCERIGDGLVLTSQVDSFAERSAGEAYRQLEKSAWITRTWGDCYGYLLVATGRAAAMIDPVMNIWDAAALQPILQEAGGTFTDWSGKPTIDAGEGIATNGRVLDEVLSVTRGFAR